jgi:hypothetical protein
VPSKLSVIPAAEKSGDETNTQSWGDVIVILSPPRNCRAPDAVRAVTLLQRLLIIIIIIKFKLWEREKRGLRECVVNASFQTVSKAFTCAGGLGCNSRYIKLEKSVTE